MESEKSLQTMLTEFDHLYVKPNDGSFGKGIYQIKHLNDVYYIHFRKDEDQSKILKCSSLHGVIKLFKKLKLETKDYIIQQGIDVKKCRVGIWIFESIRIKIGKESGRFLLLHAKFRAQIVQQHTFYLVES